MVRGEMTKPATEKRGGGLRKLPTQARSRARVADILKAAATLLGEVGYDGLSTNLVAERAQVPVGSIYQFFDRKQLNVELERRVGERAQVA